jgi:hypothetical protein
MHNIFVQILCNSSVTPSSNDDISRVAYLLTRKNIAYVGLIAGRLPARERWECRGGTASQGFWWTLRSLSGITTVGNLTLSPLEVAMRNGSSKPKPESAQAVSDSLERGQFSDGRRIFVVRASSTEAPDSFQVHAKGNRTDVILVVSGLNSGNLHATWSEEWRSASPEWREWARNNAFKTFHTVRTSSGTQPANPGKIRFCRG